ncbi:AraC family transcriptional regulator [Poseidonibacter lekithochrous]|uniref:AraC family transcriptional regulator n=1 Tax=Poseidonibacter lekithochrous TaxID=1904463 RepID=UPI000D3C3E65|nr:AraC family transcriptional regulator [Poseidonibacter lekithochrous]
MSAKIKRIKLDNIGSIELLNASFEKHSFKKHFHEEFCFGVVSSGQLDFNYRGQKVSAKRGLINLCNPGEIHDGFSSKGWAYKMFYVNPKLMAHLSSIISGRINDIPFFKEGVIYDDDLALKLNNLNDIMFNEESFTIEKEELFIEVASLFIKKHADSFIPYEKLTSSKELIIKSIEYINDNLQYDITVSNLSEMANLSLYYYIRVFKKEVGLTPKDYLIQQRIKKAKELILEKYPLSHVALMSGFYDQSHMLKYFKSYVGLNPSNF